MIFTLIFLQINIMLTVFRLADSMIEITKWRVVLLV